MLLVSLFLRFVEEEEWTERFASDIADIIYSSGGNSGLGFRQISIVETIDLIIRFICLIQYI